MSEEIIENKETKKKKQKRSWLERLKDESWEAELLVSAIAIFGTFQLFDGINWITNTFIDILNPSQYMIGFCIAFLGLLSISILASMFVIHFFLRAYWIGLVGLNSVFPDYSIEDSVYSEIYTEKILATLPKIKDSIKKVDELCSVIFSAAFTFLLIYTYVALFASVYLWLYNVLSSYVHHYILLIPLAIIILGFILQMIFGILSNIKKNHHKVGLQTWNFRIVRFVSILLYGPIYKSVMQIMMLFGSNFKKKKSIVYLLFLFVFSGAILANFKMFDTNIPYLINKKKHINSLYLQAQYYESFNDNNDFLLTPEIESDIVNTKVIKVFIPIFKNERKMRDEFCGAFNADENNTQSIQRENQRKHTLECYHKYNRIYVNDKPIAVEFMRHNHPRTDQFGIVTYIESENFNKGKNTLEIKKEFEGDNAQEWSIPFYYVSRTD